MKEGIYSEQKTRYRPDEKEDCLGRKRKGFILVHANQGLHVVKLDMNGRLTSKPVLEDVVAENF